MSHLAQIWWVLRNLAAIWRVIWKAQTGRFFYFRDEAQDFVKEWASMPAEFDDELMQRMATEARNELDRRACRAA